MYGYIYDVFLGQKQYAKELVKIENTLTDMGLQGHTIKLSLINNIAHALQEMTQRGIKTIVAVGSDQLFSKIADYAELLDGVILGLIPIGSHRQLADLFGIPAGAEACPVLSARLVRHVSLGRINRGYFIHSILVQDPAAKVRCEDQFEISATTQQAMISILNAREPEGETTGKQASFSVIVTPAVRGKLWRKPQFLPETHLRCTSVSIEEPRNVPLIVDGQKVLKTPVYIDLVSQKIQVIMGKGRKI
jgi:diacylglycerol kinase family enzyme